MEAAYKDFVAGVVPAPGSQVAVNWGIPHLNAFKRVVLLSRTRPDPIRSDLLALTGCLDYWLLLYVGYELFLHGWHRHLLWSVDSNR